MPKAKRKPNTRPSKRDKKALSARKRNKMRQMTRLLYSWRYVDHARAEAGEPIPDHHQGFNLLTPSTPEKIKSTYTIAINTPMHWQVIVIGYVRDGDDEYRSWAWIKSERPIVAAGDGITPLLAQANDIALEGLEGSDDCYARATIMAPFDASHPISPDRYAARLQKRLGLTKDEVLALADWGEPETMSVENDLLDLEIAREFQAQTDVD